MFTNHSSYKLWNWTDPLFTIFISVTVQFVTSQLLWQIGLFLSYSLLCWRSFELALNDISAFFLLSLALTWNIRFFLWFFVVFFLWNRRETRPSYLSYRLLGLLLGTRKILASWPARLRKHFGSSPLLVFEITNWELVTCMSDREVVCGS